MFNYLLNPLYLSVILFSIPFMKVLTFLVGDPVLLLNIGLLVFIDTMLGVILAIKTKSLSSEMYSNVFKKIIIYFILIICSHQISVLDTSFDYLLSWLNASILGYIGSRELLSIVENLSLTGWVKFPLWITDKLQKVRDGETPLITPPKEITNNNEQKTN